MMTSGCSSSTSTSQNWDVRRTGLEAGKMESWESSMGMGSREEPLLGKVGLRDGGAGFALGRRWVSGKDSGPGERTVMVGELDLVVRLGEAIVRSGDCWVAVRGRFTVFSSAPSEVSSFSGRLGDFGGGDIINTTGLCFLRVTLTSGDSCRLLTYDDSSRLASDTGDPSTLIGATRLTERDLLRVEGA